MQPQTGQTEQTSFQRSVQLWPLNGLSWRGIEENDLKFCHICRAVLHGSEIKEMFYDLNDNISVSQNLPVLDPVLFILLTFEVIPFPWNKCK